MQALLGECPFGLFLQWPLHEGGKRKQILDWSSRQDWGQNLPANTRFLATEGSKDHSLCAKSSEPTGIGD